jgi:DNA ligase-1
MPVLFKPMLASDADMNLLRFPLLASPKLDGVRAVVRNGVVYSRSNKPIPNHHIQSLFADLEYFDGELIFGDPCSKSRDTVSQVMSRDKTDGCSFYVFDHVKHMDIPYMERFKMIFDDESSGVIRLSQHVVLDMQALLSLEEEYLDKGYEGLILRDPQATYKMGRSTAREGILLKMKRFEDAEATVIGFEERMENTNEKTTNELGRSQRSSHRSGKVGRGDLGAVLARTASGVEFAIGTGFDDIQRDEIWKNQSDYLGQLVKYKFFSVGVKTAPRHPVFISWRNPIDTGDGS